MNQDANMRDCDICTTRFQDGPHIYQGNYLPSYQIRVCESCLRTNWDGWAPHLENAVTAKLRLNGLPIPERNAAGLLPQM
jgi:hypothetical protein